MEIANDDTPGPTTLAATPLIDGAWVKATPALNIELCERFGLLPLEFDGRRHSLYHPFDRAGRQHMEYVSQRGSFDEVPLARITAGFATVYPAWTPQATMQGARFDVDVARETS